jgi:hypothetical protein
MSQTLMMPSESLELMSVNGSWNWMAVTLLLDCEQGEELLEQK